MYLNCYACGQPGHYSANCPTRDHGAHPPARAAESREPESNRPEARPIPEPVPVSQRAAYDEVSPHAEWVREQMGWDVRASEAAEINSRAKASEQVGEARISRSDWPASRYNTATPPGPVQPLPRWTILPGDPPALQDWLKSQSETG